MNVLARHMVLVLFVWLMLAGVCLGKQVYLKDGGIIDCQSVWRRGNKVFVKVNRDIVADFDPSEIDLRRTFPKSGTPSRHSRHNPAKAATAPVPVKVAPPPAVTPPKPSVQPSPAVITPVPKPAAPAAPAPMEKAPPQPAASTTTPAESAAPPDKAELQRRSQEAAKMMIEAALKKDSGLMQKALEMQKSAIPQQGVATRKKPINPLAVGLFVLVVSLLIVVSQWVIFKKAGQAGWKSLIPIYNMYVMMEISGKPGWWTFLLLVPVVNVVFFLLAMLSLAQKFRRSELLGVGITLLPMIFLPVLAFGGSEYEG